MVIILFFSFCFSKVNPIFTVFAPAVHRLKDGTEKESISQEIMDSVPKNGNPTSGGVLCIQKKKTSWSLWHEFRPSWHWCPHRQQPIAKHHYVQVFLAFDAYYASHTWENPIQGRIMHMIHSSPPDDCYSRNFGHVLKHEICLIRCVIMRFLFAMNHHNKFLVALPGLHESWMRNRTAPLMWRIKLCVDSPSSLLIAIVSKAWDCSHKPMQH